MRGLLSGKESLATAFWFVGLGYLMAAMGFTFLMGFIPHPLVIMFSLVTMVCLFIFYEVVVWRCANNTAWIGWAWAARAIVISRAFFYVIQVPFLVSEDQASAGLTSLLGLGIDLLIGTMGLVIYVLLKVSGGNIEAPADQGEDSLADYAEEAKKLFLAGSYEAALVQFNKAQIHGQLNELSKGYQAMCQKRIQQKKRQQG